MTSPTISFFTLLFQCTLIIIVLAIAILILKKHKKPREHLSIKNVNRYFDQLQSKTIKQIKPFAHQYKKLTPLQKPTKNIYILNLVDRDHLFNSNAFQKTISTLSSVLQPLDEIILNIESNSSDVTNYGAIMSELTQLKSEKNIRLTAAIDQLGTHSGYFVACIADHIIAPPFAVVGGIALKRARFNYQGLIDRCHIGYDLITSGKYKRDLRDLGENTKLDQEKAQEKLVKAAETFIHILKSHRPQVNIDVVGTGEYWLGIDAKSHHLIDELQSLDEYLFNAKKTANIIEVGYTIPTRLTIKQKIKDCLPG